MNKQSRLVTKQDLLSLDEYANQRKILRKKLLEFKKKRRVHLGPYATFYFESYETMLAQIQEMLFIEKGGDNQLNDELTAYNPLIPKGKELVATLMFEIDDPFSRSDFLNKVGGIEHKVFMKVKNEKINSIPEQDIDRTSAEGKASSVQFIHFSFSNKQIDEFKNLDNDVILGIDHKLYSYNIKIEEGTRKALISDFN